MLPAIHKASGQFVRSLGTGKNQKPFYLGKDVRQAIVNEARLERVWEVVKSSVKESGWDEVSKAIAGAVARGVQFVKLPPTDLQGDELIDWYLTNKARFGHIIKVLPHDMGQAEIVERAIDDGVNQLEGFARTQVAIGDHGKKTLAAMRKGPTLSTIFATHTKALERERDEQGDRSGWIGTQIRQIETADRLFGSVQLNTAEDLRSVANKLVNPALKSGHGKPLARITRRKLFQQIRAALYLAEETETLPKGWANVKLPNKRDESPAEIAQFTLADLTALYGAANPLMRAVNAERPHAVEDVGVLSRGWQP
jgi:hypothetical protein